MLSTTLSPDASPDSNGQFLAALNACGPDDCVFDLLPAVLLLPAPLPTSTVESPYLVRLEGQAPSLMLVNSTVVRSVAEPVTTAVFVTQSAGANRVVVERLSTPDRDPQPYAMGPSPPPPVALPAIIGNVVNPYQLRP